MTQELMNCLCRAIERNYYSNEYTRVKVICLEDIKSAVISVAIIDQGTLDFIVKVNARGYLHNIIPIKSYISSSRVQRIEKALSIGRSEYGNNKVH